jgi:hypothetical protein
MIYLLSRLLGLGIYERRGGWPESAAQRWAVMLAIALFSGCGSEEAPALVPSAGHISRSEFHGEEGVVASDFVVVLRTVEHDDHRWVIATTSQGISALHHPDCPRCEPKEAKP